MGLIKAITGAAGGVLADQWKEFFYCDAMSPEVLVTKGQKRISSRGRSSNTSGEDNIITSGSRIAVNAGQCMLIVEQGRVVEVSAEPGEYTYDRSTEPTVFDGGMESIKEVFKRIGTRFTFGGDTGKDQRVYYVNMKEIVGNKYGTPAGGVPFRVVDQNAAIDIDIPIRCFGEYSYKIVNPILFYTSISGNIQDDYKRSEIDGQLKSELLTALQPAFARISEMGIRYSALTAHTKEIANALNDELSHDWRESRGIEIVKFGLSSVKASEEDEKKIRDRQMMAGLRAPGMAQARIADATAEAMVGAANNQSGGMGAAFGFMGMNMAQNAGANMMGALGPMPGMNTQAAAAPATWTCECGEGGNTGKFCTACGKPKPAPVAAWTCTCGESGNTGKFCTACGKPKPAANGWTCECGATNQGNFCQSCGKRRPADAPLYRCDKCGWNPPDPKHPPKFCPECGDPFDEGDRV